MKRTFLAAALIALVAVSQAAAGVRIVAVKYQPGARTLNGEWIELENTAGPAQLRGWTIRDSHGNVYRFGSYRLGTGQWVRIHTGHGHNTAHHRYWGATHEVWGNRGDTVQLRNASGNLVQRFRYPGGGTIAWCDYNDDWDHDQHHNGHTGGMHHSDGMH